MSVVNRRRLLSGAAALTGLTLLGRRAEAQGWYPNTYDDPDQRFYDTRRPRQSEWPYGAQEPAPRAYDPYGAQSFR
jgi:hypothetical protein